MRRRRRRAQTARLLVEGPRAVAEAVDHLEHLFVGRTRTAEADAVAARCTAADVPVTPVSDEVLATLADAEQPQGVVGVARRPPADLAALAAADLLVICDRVSDPGNLGAIVRTADAVGADGVVVTVGGVDPTNGKAVRASAGSLFHLPVVDGVDAGRVRSLCADAGIRLVGTAADAPVRYDELPADDRLAIVFGNEAHGMSAAMRAAVDTAVSVPISRLVRSGFTGHAESLNLATTAAVVLYEVARQRTRAGVDENPMAAHGDSALDVLPDAVVLVDANGVVVDANDLVARLVHRTAGVDLIGRRAADVLPLREHGGADWWRCTAGFDVDARLLPRIPERRVHLYVRPDVPRPVAVTGRRIAGDDGRVRQLSVAIRRAERHADAQREHSELISTASHELRAPLTSVRGFTKTLLARWDRFDDATRRQMIATIDEDADRVTRLLTELLDVSRIDAGRLPLHRRIVALHDIVEPLAHRFALERDERELVVDVPDDLPELVADPDRIAQVLSNLLDNAAKYGQGTVRIAARSHGGGDEVRCTVADEGGGIPEGRLEQLFTKHFRLDSARPGGYGLGLYISRGIIAAHGGRIRARSVRGAGTEFVFTLPTAAAQLRSEVDFDADSGDSGAR